MYFSKLTTTAFAIGSLIVGAPNAQTEPRSATPIQMVIQQLMRLNIWAN